MTTTRKAIEALAADHLHDVLAELRAARATLAELQFYRRDYWHGSEVDAP